MIFDATKPEPDSKPKVVELAENAGIKDDMLETVHELMKMYSGKTPKDFSVEEFYYMFEAGMHKAGVKNNFRLKSLMKLCHAYLYGYSLGRVITKD
jgi:hypothetical protein